MFNFKSDADNLIKPFVGEETPNYYLIVQVALALEKVGFWDIWKEDSSPKTVAQLSRLLSVREELLRTCLNFLWCVSNIVEKCGDDSFLVKKRNFLIAVYVLAAYKDVFDNIADLLTGEKIYGHDIIRDGFYLQKASEWITVQSINNAAILSAASDCEQFVDLGCGSAQSLVLFCKNNKSGVAVGIDNDFKVIQAAKSNIAKEGLQDRARIIQFDVAQIEQWRREIDFQKKTAFFASMILHEFLREGEKWLINFLSQFSKYYPNSRFFILEFDTISFEDLRKEIQSGENRSHQIHFALYKFWHPFTNQGMPQPLEVWQRIIVSAGWKLNRIIGPRRSLITFDCTT